MHILSFTTAGRLVPKGLGGFGRLLGVSLSPRHFRKKAFSTLANLSSPTHHGLFSESIIPDRVTFPPPADYQGIKQQRAGHTCFLIFAYGGAANFVRRLQRSPDDFIIQVRQTRQGMDVKSTAARSAKGEAATATESDRHCFAYKVLPFS